MKRILLIITAVTLLLTFASSGDAWQVNFTNNCDKDVKIDVYGEHLFWKSDDCRVRVSPGKSADCEMPTGICPWSIEGNVKKGHTMSNVENGYIPPIHCSAMQGVCCCWNVKVEAYKSGETCLLRIVQ